MRPHHALALGSLSLLLACSGATSAVNDPSREGACSVVKGHAAPLVVDWSPDERRAIQRQMAAGIAVVAYDCDGIRLLPACHVEGSYGYVGADRDAQVVQLKSAGELRANLPRTGAQLGEPTIAELDRGAAIDVALVTVGKRRTTRAYATAQHLVGECGGATHFIRGATIGAFALDAGSRGQARGVPEIFERGARAGGVLSATERRVQGALAACAAAKPGDDAPPDGCDAVSRIDLAAIEATGPLAGAPTRPLGDLDPECGAGMVWSAGKCTAPGEGTLQLCNTASYDDCSAQCNRGEPKSCFALGWMFENGRGVARDLARAQALYQGACDHRAAAGCRGLGWLYSEGIGVPRDAEVAATLYQRACDGGDADACSNMGHMYGTGEGVPKDYTLALHLSKKGCDGGDPNGCNNLGLLDENGWGVARDLPRAVVHYRQACDGGNAMGCANLGNMLVLGRGVPADRAQGLELLRRGCVGGHAWGCTKLQQLQANP